MEEKDLNKGTTDNDAGGNVAGNNESGKEGGITVESTVRDTQADNDGHRPAVDGGGDAMKSSEETSWQKHKQPLWIDMFAILGVFLASIVVGGLVAFIIQKTANADMGFALFTGYLINFLIPISFSVWFLKKKGRRERRSRNFFRVSMKKVNPTLILWGFVLVLISSVVIEPVLSLLPDSNLGQLQKIVDMGGWAMMMTVVAAPVLEEVFFRGIIQEELTSEYGGVKGVLLAAAFFGLAHIQVPQQALNAFFIGIILGYIYVKTKSLVPVILIHAMNNAIAYILMLLFRDRIVMMKDVIGNRTVYWAVYLLCVAVFFTALIGVYREIAGMKKENGDK